MAKTTKEFLAELGTKITIDGNTVIFSNNIALSDGSEIVMPKTAGIFANGSFGLPGQVLTSNGSAIYWAAGGGGGGSVNTDAQYTWTNVHTFTSNLILTSIVANNTLGFAGQVLTTDGTTVYWAAGGGGGSVNTDAQYTWTNTQTFVNTVTYDTAGAIVYKSGNKGSVIIDHQDGDGNFVFYRSNTSGQNEPVLSFFANPDPTNTFFKSIFFNQDLTLSGFHGIVTGGPEGSKGTPGQVLTTDGTTVYWGSGGGGGSVNTDAQYTWTNTQIFTNTVTYDMAGTIVYKSGNEGSIIIDHQDGDGNFVFYRSNTTSGYEPVLSFFANPDITSNFQKSIFFNQDLTLSGFHGIITGGPGGTKGTPGQVLTTDGTTVYWAAGGGGGGSVNTDAQYIWANIQTFSNTVIIKSGLRVINTAPSGANVEFYNQPDGNFVLYNGKDNPILSLNTAAGASSNKIRFTSTLQLEKAIEIAGSNGAPGQILSSTGTGLQWIAAGAAGVNTAAQYTWTNTHSFAANVTFSAGIIAGGSTGTAGQILSSTGSGLQWIAAGAAGVNTDAQYTWTNTQTFTNTVTFDTAGTIVYKSGNKGSILIDHQDGDGNFVFYRSNTSGQNEPVFSFFANPDPANTFFKSIFFNQDLTLSGFHGIVTGGPGGTKGTPGQVLTTDGTTVYWGSGGGGGSVNTDAQYTWTNVQTFSNTVLIKSGMRFTNTAAGANAEFYNQTDGNFVLYNGTNNPIFSLNTTAGASSNKIRFTSTLQLEKAIEIAGSNGTSGQILSSTGSGVAWINPAAASVNTAATYAWTNTHSFAANVTFSAGIIAGGTTGTAGQILSSTGSGVQWIAAGASGVNTAAQYTWTNTNIFSPLSGVAANISIVTVTAAANALQKGVIGLFNNAGVLFCGPSSTTNSEGGEISIGYAGKTFNPAAASSSNTWSIDVFGLKANATAPQYPNCLRFINYDASSNPHIGLQILPANGAYGTAYTKFLVGGDFQVTEAEADTELLNPINFVGNVGPVKSATVFVGTPNTPFSGVFVNGAVNFVNSSSRSTAALAIQSDQNFVLSTTTAGNTTSRAVISAWCNANNSLAPDAQPGGNGVFVNPPMVLLNGIVPYGTGSRGANNQVLMSTGTNVKWADIPAGGVNTDAQYTWTNTHTFNAVVVNKAGMRFTNTASSGANAEFYNQPDGNFVLYNGTNNPIFSVNTAAGASSNKIRFTSTLQLERAIEIAGSNGTSGQVLSSTGTGVQWITPGASGVNTAAAYTWSNVHTFNANVIYGSNTYFVVRGKTANVTFVNQADGIFTFYSGSSGNVGAAAVWSVNCVGNSDRFRVFRTLELNGGLAIGYDGSLGLNGQVLTSTGTGVQWITPAAASVNTAAQYTWSNVHTFNANIVATRISAGGSTGSAGQVLSSTGTGLQWITPVTPSVNTAAQYIWTNTHTFNAVTVYNADTFVSNNKALIFRSGSSDVTFNHQIDGNFVITACSAPVISVFSTTATRRVRFHRALELVGGGIAIGFDGSTGSAGQVLTADGSGGCNWAVKDPAPTLEEHEDLKAKIAEQEEIIAQLRADVDALMNKTTTKSRKKI